MTAKTTSAQAIESYKATRFNALRHGILSRFTVLPCEDADEYRALVEALAAEHTPEGPTEEHLVEELAGILWRKRRLRLAEAATHRRGLKEALKPYRETVNAALVHLDVETESERVIDAIRATASSTETDIADVQEDGTILNFLAQTGMTLTRPQSRHSAWIRSNGGHMSCNAAPTIWKKMRRPSRLMARVFAASSNRTFCLASVRG